MFFRQSGTIESVIHDILIVELASDLFVAKPNKLPMNFLLNTFIFKANEKPLTFISVVETKR